MACFISLQLCVAKDNATNFLKSHERNSVSLQLEFARKNPNALQRIITFLDWNPNGYATGFFVGNRLVMTAYHVVSGNLDISKKIALGFDRNDQLEVRVFANGCPAKVIKIDADADLALLEVCRVPGQPNFPAFQSTLTKDEDLLLIARPHGQKIVRHGTFYGAYSFNGIEYWSGKLAPRDGFSGSPVYNQQGQLIGVFSGYDWTQKLAIISPGSRAQKLLEEFASKSGP